MCATDGDGSGAQMRHMPNHKLSGSPAHSLTGWAVWGPSEGGQR
ncbi:hypothetical protein GCM10022232_46910 [Streptomyces plumbiresistens]|uniref:Uncharacterized protein n=1 Tax=Streptomyces plumbiresistens TaxID=511811 RepID=A0ABP7RV77_9ACTN